MGIYGSLYKIPKAIFHVLKGDYKVLSLGLRVYDFGVWGSGFRVGWLRDRRGSSSASNLGQII